MLTKYGLPQVAVFPSIVGCIIALLAIFLRYWWIIPIEALLLVVLIWIFSFFRDPGRIIASDENILYSPCDGTVTEIKTEDGLIKVSMFLSIYNVHINRSPCRAVVKKVIYKKGQFRNANDPESSRLNEANDMELEMLSGAGDVMTVRQVSGAVARRIVCRAKPGDVLDQGQQYGMIKFGSRTELILPDGENREVCVKLGDKVRAGLTAIIRYG